MQLLWDDGLMLAMKRRKMSEEVRTELGDDNNVIEF
jgi:hypothetical protein